MENQDDVTGIDQEAGDSTKKEAEKESDKSPDQYETICYMCHRPESKAGSMIGMPGGICMCHDCMQRAFDSVSHGNLDLSKLQHIPYVNLDHLHVLTEQEPGTPQKQRIKKKKERRSEPSFSLKDIPAPHIIKQQLDEYVIGQDQAKKVISVAVYNHYKRIYVEQMEGVKSSAEQDQAMDPEGGISIEKSNLLMIGPTGSGKTYLVKTLAKLLDVPLAIADATALTEAGYIGDDIESVVSKLLAAADNDVEKAEHGIIFIDEIDKIAKKHNMNTRDVSGESVQQELLKLLEGSRVEVPVGSNQKNALTPMTTVNTDHILFICGGAFPDLEDIIRERLNKKSSMGFGAELKDRYDKEVDLLKHVAVEDLRKFGMIPEFLGRLPITVTLQGLTKELLVKILQEPKNAILKQYIKLLELDEVKLVFEQEALEWIAQEAIKRETGARALRAILEDYMLDIMYEIPKDSNIGSVVITRPYLEKSGGPVVHMRGQD